MLFPTIKTKKIMYISNFWSNNQSYLRGSFFPPSITSPVSLKSLYFLSLPTLVFENFLFPFKHLSSVVPVMQIRYFFFSIIFMILFKDYIRNSFVQRLNTNSAVCITHKKHFVLSLSYKTLFSFWTKAACQIKNRHRYKYLLTDNIEARHVL